MLSPGIRFGPYEIGAPIGSGGMGEVYRARDSRLDRVVALKVLPSTLSVDSQALQRFEREARAIAALNHPNICTVHDVGEAPDPDRTRFIVMELLEGETLRQSLERGALDAAALVDVAIALTGALDAAHRKGIVHRDIKPSNIFLTSHGPKLLDFGLATPSESIADASRQATVEALTGAGTTVGTVAYMSPEQLRADALDARTDLFSFGAVLYEMATGRQAFSGNTAAVITHAILEKAPRPIREIRSTVPPELDRIIGRTLEKDRELRYQSAADLRSDLERLKRDIHKAVPAAAAGDAGRLRRRRTLGRAIAAGALMAALIAVSAGAYVYLGSRDAITSLAVLPFTHQGSDANTEYLSSGITESLINSLSELPGLRILSRNTVLSYRGRDVDPRVAGRELQVQSVLTGRVTPYGDMLDIQSELVDVASGAQLWGQRYRRPLSALLTVQDEIAREISATLRPALSGEDERRIARRYPTTPRPIACIFVAATTSTNVPQTAPSAASSHSRKPSDRIPITRSPTPAWRMPTFPAIPCCPRPPTSSSRSRRRSRRWPATIRSPKCRRRWAACCSTVTGTGRARSGRSSARSIWIHATPRRTTCTRTTSRRWGGSRNQ